MGAHYDHTGIVKRTGLVRNGADDNASGTAMITELARYYAGTPDASSNYLVIALSGEEEGLLGSYYFAAHPTIDLGTVSFMFNFDMVGRLGCRGNRVDAVCTATSPAWKEILKDASTGDFRVRKIPGAGEFSDHAPFYKKDLPIAYLTTGLHYDYHTSRDDAEKINYQGMLAVYKYARGIIAGAGKQGKVPFHKVSKWNNARSMLYYIGEQLDYVLTVGLRDLE
jgi:Zn-dependent M28 family amino/carboxypeptidase